MIAGWEDCYFDYRGVVLFSFWNGRGWYGRERDFICFSIRILKKLLVVGFLELRFIFGEVFFILEKL